MPEEKKKMQEQLSKSDSLHKDMDEQALNIREFVDLRDNNIGMEKSIKDLSVRLAEKIRLLKQTINKKISLQVFINQDLKRPNCTKPK